MPATLAERKRADIAVKSGALRGELERWRAASEGGQQLEKHHSQVLRIAARIEGLLDRVEAEPDGPGTDFLAQARALEEKLLTAHTIWEFFRAKLAQRVDQTFTEHLRVCDEFAWACYEPARKKFLACTPDAASKVREPPLVFLNGGYSPYAVGRATSFQVERAAGGWLAQQEFRDVIENLPVPLVGLPWFQVAQLPDALVIGHEIGHIVEWEFALKDDLCRAVDGAPLPAQRREAWQSWRLEVFADVYGCLAGGAAFAGSLADFLAQSKARLTAEKRNPGAWGDYPPVWLRVAVLVSTLVELGYDPGALPDTWNDTYGPAPSNTEFAHDADVIVKALLDCPCTTMALPGEGRGRTPKVRELLPALSEDPRAVATNLGTGNAPGSENPRVLLAAARELWVADPTAYVKNLSSDAIRDLIPTPHETRGMAPEDLEASATRERDLGNDWFDGLFAAGNS